ncbi:MAG: DUF3016 domain-containing protein [Pseudomonadota bacterium]
MNILIKQAALAAMLMMVASAAAAGASVTYKDPERFADVPFAPWEREQLLKELTAHFDVLAARLPAGQTLAVEVTDLDLAGRIHPNRMNGPLDLRILTGGADWPHITLRYTISEGGKVVKTGEERLSNMSYLQRQNRYRNDSLKYEKQMLDDWFSETIAQR